MKNHKSLFINRFFFVISALLVVGIGIFIYSYFFSKPAIASWFDESWLYRKAIAITNNTGSAQTNTQVSFTLGTASLISSGKMQSSCADIRITNSTGNLLKYWTEYCDTTGTNSSVIWATIDSIPTGTSTIYVYYGNPSAPAASQYITAPTGINVGTGNDGDITLSTTKTTDTDTIATGRSYADSANWNIATSITSGATTVTLPSTPNGLAVGDEILIINLRDPNNADATNYGYAVQSTATSGTATTLVDSAKSWTTNAYQNMTLVITSGTGQGQSRTISSNDATSLTVSSNWTTNPDATSVYKVLDPNGWTNNINNIHVGQYETRRITAINSNTLTLNQALTNSYDGTTYKIMVQRIPQYGNVTINASGILTVSAYNNTNGVGGVLFFRASGTVNVNASGSIDVSGKGYAGGVKGSGGYGGTTYNGAGGRGGAQGSGPTINGISGQGGGGGGGGDGCGDSGIGAVGTIGGAGGAGAQCYGGAGAGGGYGTVGSKGGGGPAGVDGDGIIGGKGGTSTGDGGGGGGGGLYGSANLSQLYLGSGAGGGANDNGGTGGNGGGIIFIGANTIIVSGTAGANGANGAGATATEGGGGGGAGGSVYIKAAANTVGSSLITASGGIGGTPGRHAGGAGGVGRIRVDYSTLSGTTSPATGSTSVLPVSGTSATEEQGPGPVGYWKFDDAQGTTAQDSSSSNNDGTISGATWVTEDQCISGKCLSFVGTNSAKVTAGSTVTGVQTVSFWVNPKTTTQSIMDFDGGTHKITVASGVVTATGFAGTTVIYVNGKVTSTLSANTWSHIEITTTTSFNATSLKIGYDNSTYFNGFIDDVKIYPYARTSAQIKADYNSRGSQIGTSVQIGPQSKALSDGLVGYWKMDEASWTGVAGEVTDSSGNGLNGTSENSTTTGVGRFGNGGSFNGSTNDVKVMTTTAMNWDNAQARSASVWVKFTTTPGRTYLIDKEYLNGGSLTAGMGQWSLAIDTNSKPTLSIARAAAAGDNCDAVGATTMTSGTWYHLMGTYDGAICKIFVNGVVDGTATRVVTSAATSGNGDFFFAKRGNTTFLLNGSMDEVRIYNRALSPKEVSDLYNFAPGPVAYYDFEDATGSTLSDRSGYGNNGTWAGTGVKHWDTGKVGKAGKFNGTDDYVDAGNQSVLSFTKSFTIGSWVKTTTAAVQYIFTKSNASTGNNSYLFAILANGKLQFYLNGQASCVAETAFVRTGNSAVNDGKWHYVSGVYDSVAQTLDVYVDGNKDNGTLSGTIATSIPDCSRNARIGLSADNYYYFNGQIDEVKLYNYARTQKQILADYGTGLAQKEPIGYWKFDEGQGTTANNFGNGGSTLNGTLTGMSAPATSTSGWTSSGKFGKGLIFDGSNDYVDLTDLSTYDIPSSGSVFLSAWVKTSSATTQDVFSNYGCTQHYYRIAVNSTGVIYFNDRGTTDTPDEVAGIKSINDGNWHHIAAGRNGTTGKLEIYVDGVLDKQQSVIHTDAISPTVNGSIGRNRSTCNSQNYFNGSIDEVKIYNYALTSEEILTDYNKGSSLIMGAAGNNSSYAPQAANQQYCVPGDTTSCVAPVAEWNFEEGIGTSVNDSSGNANTGTWSGTGTQHWTTGKVGKAGKFNGTDDYVSINDASSIEIGQNASATISLWYYSTASNNNAYALIAKRSGDQSYNTDYTFFTESGNFYWGTGTSDDSCAWQAITEPSRNAWHHVEATISSTGVQTGTKKLFVDGVQQGSCSYTNKTVSNNHSMYIGKCDGSVCYWPGKIDQVRIYNYARSAAQIAWDYNRGAPVGHWKFDECQGSVAHDISDNSNHGTITIGASGEDTLGTCTTSSTAWGSGATGKYNSSMSFDGIDDYVDMGNPSNGLYNFGANNFSLSAWIKAAVHGVYSVVDIVSKDNSGARQFSFFKNAGSADDIRFSIFVGGSEVSLTTATNVITDTNWHHVTAVRSGTNAYIYVDGVLVKSGAMSGTMDITSTTLKVGASDWGHYFKGQIDDVKVFNYALTPLQIKTLYNNGAVYFGPTSGTP